MNFKFKNVYLNATSIVAGPYEKNPIFINYFDEIYDDLYLGEKSWELAEIKLIHESVNILLSKTNMERENINIHLSGDLLNQLVATNYASAKIGIPLIGVYAACATSTLSLILGSILVDNYLKNAICSTSSHNAAAEKQFRYPVEYGGPKRCVTTFTTTAGCSALISRNKKGVRIDTGTIGTVVDMGVKDVYNMGAVMAPAAAKVLVDHLRANKRKASYYDLILTGDLGIYGSKIFEEYLKSEYGIILDNYKDAGSMVYDNKKYAGGSGPACMPLVAYGYIFSKLKKHEYKKVLLIATGALHNQTLCNEKMSIPAIAHAISLEAI